MNRQLSALSDDQLAAFDGGEVVAAIEGGKLGMR